MQLKILDVLENEDSECEDYVSIDEESEKESDKETRE
tara:strand:+ start:1753 stop:1863 length:111 start_codon:yes stop_codon:yes gene_type:complete